MTDRYLFFSYYSHEVSVLGPRYRRHLTKTKARTHDKQMLAKCWTTEWRRWPTQQTPTFVCRVSAALRTTKLLTMTVAPSAWVLLLLATRPDDTKLGGGPRRGRELCDVLFGTSAGDVCGYVIIRASTAAADDPCNVQHP